MSYITLHPPVLRNIILFKEIQSVLIVSACLTGTQQPSAGSGSLSASLPACVQLAVLDSHAEPLLQQTVFICQRLRFCLSSAAAKSRREKSQVGSCYQTCNGWDGPGLSGGKLGMFWDPSGILPRQIKALKNPKLAA